MTRHLLALLALMACPLVGCPTTPADDDDDSAMGDDDDDSMGDDDDSMGDDDDDTSSSFELPPSPFPITVTTSAGDTYSFEESDCSYYATSSLSFDQRLTSAGHSWVLRVWLRPPGQMPGPGTYTESLQVQFFENVSEGTFYQATTPGAAITMQIDGVGGPDEGVYGTVTPPMLQDASGGTLELTSGDFPVWCSGYQK